MLILTRKVNQGVRMYDETGRYMGRLLVLGVERDRVKFGFDVDSRFTFLRDEVAERAGKVLEGEWAK